ncbi:MAG: glycine cleavage system aminomethyltransferase GcvT [Chloroflexi bacterium]|nr:glycine cleavage system aminomethyltransferase GcvT [Chloroflexota bacterium]
MDDFLFRGSMQDLDPAVFELSQYEAERQVRRLILIPSESSSPAAVREALSTPFHNIYAEGYPDEATRWMTEEQLLDYDARLGHYRRYSDPRYYKGVEYADIVEALARRRCAETFAANGVSADDLYVNVQALSGAPANNAVYHALVNPGDTVMGMDLLHGGHLSHGSPVNRSGKYYNIVHYTVDPQTERIDYEAVAALAHQHKPKMIIGGFSSYPWPADWAALRAIADSVGAYLLADMAHVAGLVAAGVYPSPVGHAHVITSTTHKTLCGPRGAIILTTNRELSRKIDRAVFPGEQGGPHVNVFAALAITFKLARTPEFRSLQEQIVKNCAAFTQRFQERGFRIPFGGTGSHLMNLDVRSVQGPDGTPLTGDMAARILDLAGIVVNRNTIPGDRSALNPSGIRMGTPWITQRGFGEKETAVLADVIADLLQACTPFRQESTRKLNQRAKVDFAVLQDARLRTRNLALTAGIDFTPPTSSYPHFFYADDRPASDSDHVALDIHGPRADQFMNFILSADLEDKKAGSPRPATLNHPDGPASVVIAKAGTDSFRLSLPAKDFGRVATWLRDLSDGYVKIDDDLLRKLPGPISIKESEQPADAAKGKPEKGDTKPYFIGAGSSTANPLPDFTWTETEPTELRVTSLHAAHKALGAKMVPFAGWDMPVWYSSVVEEHLAVRQAAGLFDVSHMGVYQAEGSDAATFLDSVCGNDISALKVGESLYTHFLDPDANVIDDLLVYRRGEDRYLVVVNASNDDKDWAWLQGIRSGELLVDRKRSASRAFGRNVRLRNLRDPKEGDDMRVDIALQGPKSREILLSLGVDEETRARIAGLKRTELCEAVVGGFDLVVSRTGYTGESMAFELFIHPGIAPELWDRLLEAGAPLGLKPCGLGARDSLRTEAGLPLYGHEMGGELNLGVGEAAFGTYVKTYKPWFVGRDAFLAREAARKGRVARFRFMEKGVRMAHLGDPVLDKRGKVIGKVTSCAIDSDGFLTGQAFVESEFTKKDTPWLVFQSASDKPGKTPAELKPGDRATIPTPAIVISRFPKA